MNLSFKNLGPIDGFIQWLKNFATMSPSLLIEVDAEQEKFVSKAFTVDKGLVRYSEISFADANLAIVEGSDIPAVRLKLGIFLMLPKFITVCETFSTTDFTIQVDYETLNEPGSPVHGEFVSDAIRFVSKSLKMTVNECSPAEFTYLSDEIFNQSIHVANDAVKITVTPDQIKNLIAISGIFAADSKKDIMILYSKETEDGAAIYARDKNTLYDYELGSYVPTGKFQSFSASIFREKLILSMKGVPEEVELLMSTINPTRILLDTVSGTSKTVISIVNE